MRGWRRACCMGVATQNCTKGSSSWIGLMRCEGPTHHPVCAQVRGEWWGESDGRGVVGRGNGQAIRHEGCKVRVRGGGRAGANPGGERRFGGRCGVVGCRCAVGRCGGGWVWGGEGGGSRLPAGDGEGLARGGDGDRALEHTGQRGEVLVRLTRVDRVLVDLVGDDEQPRVAAHHLRHLRHLRGAEGLARGVVRRVEHEHLGARRDLRRASKRDVRGRCGGAMRRDGAVVRWCGDAA